MDRKCPQCGSVETGPSFTFDYDRDDAGRVVALVKLRSMRLV